MGQEKELQSARCQCSVPMQRGCDSVLVMRVPGCAQFQVAGTRSAA
jgi:hypothetical protein